MRNNTRLTCLYADFTASSDASCSEIPGILFNQRRGSLPDTHTWSRPSMAYASAMLACLCAMDVWEGVAEKLEGGDEKRAPLTAQTRPNDLRVHSLFRKYRPLTRPLNRVDAIFLRSATSSFVSASCLLVTVLLQAAVYCFVLGRSLVARNDVTKSISAAQGLLCDS